ncbi:MAG: homoserine dehydrogenase [Verrucomicrobiota bacterium]
MENDKPVVRIGLLGLGVVGQGVWKHVETNREALELRLGCRIELYKAGVRNLAKPREVQLTPEQLTEDLEALAVDPQVDILCELMGGTDRALDLTRAALAAGKVVVTANKALICQHGEALFEEARRGGGHYLFEASVAGGIPVIKALREGLVANRFPEIFGILNGTCNYILTRMEREGLTFGETVGEARRLGYVEADESLDLDGKDAAHKAAILTFLAHGKWVGLDEICIEGIRQITLEDVEIARELGYKIKLLAVIRRDFEADRLTVCVAPHLIETSEVVAGVDEVFNAVSLGGDIAGTNVLIGRGAGQDATASSVIGDIADGVLALRGRAIPQLGEADREHLRAIAAGCTLATPEEIFSRFYLRLEVDDRPGVLAEIARLMAAEDISLATVTQRTRGGSAGEAPRGEAGTAGAASLVLTTHRTSEAAMQRALEQLKGLAANRGEAVRFRIFEPRSEA